MWIDGEWNSYRGGLISLALVTECGREFYAEVINDEVKHPWVQENVMPHLRNIEVLTYEEMQFDLMEFLAQFDGEIEIVSDWPEDIEVFCRALVVGPGQVHTYRPIKFTCNMGGFQGAKSAIPHMALADAMANRAWQLAQEAS